MRFLSDSRGNVALMLALSVLPMLICGGFAVELNRQQLYERDTVAALDFAALATARHKQEFGGDTQELLQVAQTNFDLNYTATGDGIDFSPVALVNNDDEIIVSIEGRMPSTILGLIGRDHLSVRATSGAVYGRPVEIELVLALDVSRSMEGAGLAGLRVAADALIDQLVTPDNTGVQLGIVPFNNFVNIGTSHAGESWLDAPADETITFESCPIDAVASQAAGCSSSRTCADSGLFGGGDEACRTDWSCPAGGSIIRQTCFNVSEDREWLGCMNSRPYPLSIADADYNDTPVPGYLMPEDWPCHEENEVVPLTDNAEILRDAVDGLEPEWDTYIAPGLTWARRVLSQGAPFTEARLRPGIGGRQAIILMSDGANTRSANSSGVHWGTNVTLANDLTLEVCESIKADSIDLYTVDYGVDDADTEQLLRECATSPDHNFEADNTSELRDTFLNIASRYDAIALSR